MTTTTKTFEIERHGQLPLRFRGEVIADVTSKEYDDQERWQEVWIYRTESGRWVTETLGCTIVPGEITFRHVAVCDTPSEVRESLYRKVHNKRHFSKYAIAALEDAAEQDRELTEALYEPV